MAFFGTYLEVTPHSRLVWTNEEGGEGGPVTTVTFEDKGGKTLLVLHELYPSKEALDAAGTGRRMRWSRRSRNRTSFSSPCSMSRRGDCYDNAVMESFFSTVKSELADRFVSFSRPT